LRFSTEMALLEETYRQIDPDGVLNMAFVDEEIKEKNAFSIKEKNGRSPLDA
jgi:hypothetical protein